MDHSKIILIDKIEFQEAIFWKISLKPMHHILVFELSIRSIVIDNGKQRPFVTKNRNHIIVGRRINILNLLFKSVFSQNDHFILKDVSVVLFEQLLVGEVYAELFQGVGFEVLEAKDV